MVVGRCRRSGGEGRKVGPVTGTMVTTCAPFRNRLWRKVSQSHEYRKGGKKKMSKRVHLSDVKADDDYDLRLLLEKFIKKSEELEKRESKVLQQVELVQSAVASLQAWKQGVKPPTPTTPSHVLPLRIDLNKIDQETKEIREETERIQREVSQKIEDNKRLQEEINRRYNRNNLLTAQLEQFVPDNFFTRVDEDATLSRMDRKQIETRPIKPTGYPPFTYDPGIDFFNDKLRRLKHLEKKVKTQLQHESEEARRKRKTLSEKIDLLEREAHLNSLLSSSLRKAPPNTN